MAGQTTSQSIELAVLQHPPDRKESENRVISSLPPPTRKSVEELVDLLPSKHHTDAIEQVISSDSWLQRQTGRRPRYTTIHLKRGEDMVDGNVAQDLRNIPVPIKTKRKIRKDLKREEPQKSSKTREQNYDGISDSQRLKEYFLNVRDFFVLWRHHLKVIEGHFGSSVASYFHFIRALVFLNVPLFLLMFTFVVLPQILFRWLQQIPPGYSQNVSFTGAELLTGKGWFLETELYYGYYTNSVINITGVPYDMKYAYICSTIGYYVLVLIILVYMLSGAYKRSYVQTSNVFTLEFAKLVFSSCDYGIMSKQMAELEKKRNTIRIKELLSEAKHEKKEKDLSELMIIWLLRILINSVILGIIVAAGYLMWYLTTRETFSNPKGTFIEHLTLPLSLSALNYVLPLLFTIVIRYERYESSKVKLYLTMFRTILLNLGTLGVLVYSWFILAKKSEGWETFIGAQLYSLAIIDFLFAVVSTFLMEFVFRIFLSVMDKYRCSEEREQNDQMRERKPEFNVGRNCLSAIYSQILVWLGVYYSPMLSFIMTLKLVIIFYIKKLSLMKNCRPPSKAWRAREASTVLYAFTFISFLLSAVSFVCGIFIIEPSRSSGPYRDYNHTYEVLSSLTDSFDSSSAVLDFIINFLTSASFLAFVAVVLLVAAYFCHLVSAGYYEIAELLKKQLNLEEADKHFLKELLKKEVSSSALKFSKTDGSQDGEFINPEVTSARGQDPSRGFIGTINPIFESHPSSPTVLPKRYYDPYAPTE